VSIAIGVAVWVAVSVPAALFAGKFIRGPRPAPEAADQGVMSGGVRPEHDPCGRGPIKGRHP
jgi:hypothetical protein